MSFKFMYLIPQNTHRKCKILKAAIQQTFYNIYASYFGGDEKYRKFSNRKTPHNTYYMVIVM